MVERRASGHDFGGRHRQGAAVIDDAVSAWFVREIVPLEATLMRYLQHNRRNSTDIQDVRQEVYARVLESARDRIPDNPKHFLLACARNLLIDLVRREQVVPMETFADLDPLGIATATPAPDRGLIERDEKRRFEAALEKLPPRTREAVRLAYFQGLSGKDIARRMRISHSAACHLLANGALAMGNILYDTSDDGDEDR